jgi:superfamily II DNA or RNA helicase
MDEVHCCQEGSLRTHCLLELTRSTKRRLGLTGTPADEKLEHFDTLFHIVYRRGGLAYPFQPGELERKFTTNFQLQRSYKTGEVDFSAKKAVPVLATKHLGAYASVVNRLAHYLSHTDPEVAEYVTWPPVNTYYEVLEMAPTQAKLYQEQLIKSQEQMRANQRALQEQRLSVAEKTKLRADTLQQIWALRQMSSCPWVTTDLQSTAKTDYLLQLISNCSGHSLVFTEMVEVAQALALLISEAGHEVLYLHAGLSRRERFDLVARFLYEEGPFVFLSTYGLAGTGIDLITARQVILHDFPWEERIISQAIARAVRPGQIHPVVDTYWLMHERTVDVYIEAIVRQKGKTNQRLTRFEVTPAATKQATPTGELLDTLLDQIPF